MTEFVEVSRENHNRISCCNGRNSGENRRKWANRPKTFWRNSFKIQNVIYRNRHVRSTAGNQKNLLTPVKKYDKMNPVLDVAFEKRHATSPHANVAQSVEQLIRNQQVVCSSHIISSRWTPPVFRTFFSKYGWFFAGKPWKIKASRLLRFEGLLKWIWKMCRDFRYSKSLSEHGFSAWRSSYASSNACGVLYFSVWWERTSL